MKEHRFSSLARQLDTSTYAPHTLSFPTLGTPYMHHANTNIYIYTYTHTNTHTRPYPHPQPPLHPPFFALLICSLAALIICNKTRACEFAVEISDWEPNNLLRVEKHRRARKGMGGETRCWRGEWGVERGEKSVGGVGEEGRKGKGWGDSCGHKNVVFHRMILQEILWAVGKGVCCWG